MSYYKAGARHLGLNTWSRDVFERSYRAGGFDITSLAEKAVDEVKKRIRDEAAKGAKEAVAPVARKQAAEGARSAVMPIMIGVGALSAVSLVIALRK